MSETVVYLTEAMITWLSWCNGGTDSPKVWAHGDQSFHVLQTPFLQNQYVSMNLKPKPLLEMITVRDITNRNNSQTYLTMHLWFLIFGNYCPFKLRFQICTYSTK